MAATLSIMKWLVVVEQHGSLPIEAVAIVQAKIFHFICDNFNANLLLCPHPILLVLPFASLEDLYPHVPSVSIPRPLYQ